MNKEKRKEVAMTYSIKKQQEIRKILAENGIECFVEIIDRKAETGSGGARTLDEMKRSTEYILFVKEEDYKKAMELLR